MRLVWHLEMNDRHFGVDQRLSLLRREVDADWELPIFFVVLSEILYERGGEPRRAHRSDPLDLRKTRHGQNAGDQRHANPGCVATIAEAEDVGVVIEQLSHHDVPAGIDRDAKWIDRPVRDGLTLLREELAREAAMASVAEAMAIRNASAEVNAKILSAIGRLPAAGQADLPARIDRNV